MTFYNARSIDHLSLAKHLTAEKQTEEFQPGRGTITRWKKEHKNNHWLDAAYIACAAANYVGVQLVQSQTKQPSKPQQPERSEPAILTPDGRPFLITER